MKAKTLSQKDQAIVRLIQAKEWLQNGKLKDASTAIASAIVLIGKDDPMAVDDEIALALKNQ